MVLSMDKNYLIQITNDLYRLTLLFPKKEPLRYKIRELADNILAKFLRCAFESNPAKTVENCSQPLLDDIKVLDGFFEVVKSQNWVKPVEILRIQEEYSRIRAEIKKIPKRVSNKETTQLGPAQIEKAINKDKPETSQEQQPQQMSNYETWTRNVEPVFVSESSPSFSAEKSFEKFGNKERQQKILEILREKGKAQVWEIKKFFPSVTKRTLRRDFKYLLKQGLVERVGMRNETFYQPR